MPLNPATKDLLSFLQKNPPVRAQICAAPNKTLLYAGNFFRPVWQELDQLKRTNPQVADKEILPDILGRIHLHRAPFGNLLDWAKSIDPISPWNENGFIVWRALSGIFASNAQGAVSFYIGSGVSRENKVFAATELHVLARNQNVDPTTQDIIEYYLRCVKSRQVDMNFAFIAG